MEELIFELAADIEGNSKAIPELFWIRNRINPPTNTLTERGEHVFKIIQNKLEILFSDIDDLKIEILMNSFRRHLLLYDQAILRDLLFFLKEIYVRYLRKNRLLTLTAC